MRPSSTTRLGLAAVVALLVARSAAAVCTGDCNGDDAVAVNECVTMVNVAMAVRPLSACPAGDANGNGVIAIDEIVTAVDRALSGCQAGPAPTATPTLMPCSGTDLSACAASCGGPGRDGCCPLSNPPACFDSTNGSIAFTQCGSQPSAACVLASNPTPTPTGAGVPTPTHTPGGGTPPPTATPVAGAGTQVSVVNQTGATTTVYVNFGADSAITQSNWASFCSGAGLSCQFALLGGASRALPNPSGAYLNATFSFDAALTCNVTKAEVNVNNPSWYDILDVSLVDGYSNDVAIIATPSTGSAIQLGPPNGQSGNETVYGLYPYGCDVCVARCAPPCDIAKSNPLVGCTASCTACQSNGVDGGKAGTQTEPTVPCQYQGPRIGGGGQTVQVVLMP